MNFEEISLKKLFDIVFVDMVVVFRLSLFDFRLLVIVFGRIGKEGLILVKFLGWEVFLSVIYKKLVGVVMVMFKF